MKKLLGDAQLEEAHELKSIARFRGQEIRDFL